MVGEIGGDAEERAADFIAESVSKPVVAYIAGLHRAARQADGPRRRDHLRLLGDRRGQEGRPRGQGRPRRPTSPTETAQLAVETIGARP